ncbi:MAG: tetratricopeptide repeat protein [Myxococcota bacterium]
MSTFSLAEVARVVGLPTTRVQALVDAHILTPCDSNGPEEARFSFRDLVLCRSARELIEDQVSPDRLIALLHAVRDRLPDEQPLSGIGLVSEGSRVVARDGQVCWEVDSGQVRFDFEDEPEEALPPVVNLGPAPEKVSSEGATMTALEWFDLALELEAKHPEQARDAYRRALEIDPHDLEARLNIARLLRRAGLADSAEAHYRLCADLHPDDARPVTQLGLLLESQARWWDAVSAYELAVKRSPQSADVFRKLAGLYERLGESTRALRALKTYRTLTEPGAP